MPRPHPQSVEARRAGAPRAVLLLGDEHTRALALAATPVGVEEEDRMIAAKGAMTWDEQVLRYDPFAGDKDDGGYRLLRDHIVTARVAGLCAECGQAIVPGTRIRAMTAVGNGHVATARSCHDCCDAMTRWMNGDEGPMEARYALRDSRGR